MKFIEIKEIKKIHYTGKVYDLEIKDDHSYNINGIVVHNSDFVMAGSIFVGHDECECEIIEENNKKYVIAYGMSSKMAQEKHFNIKNYRASEGREVKALYKGSVESTISEILGGLRSTLTYIGANKLKEASKRTTFVMVNRQVSNYFNDVN